LTSSDANSTEKSVQELLDFIIEQLDAARSPLDQLGGVDAAGGVIPFLRSKLEKDQWLAANIALAYPFSNYVQSAFRDELWKDLAHETPQRFAEVATELIDCIHTLKTAISNRPNI
jgi:hypothetical protein